MSFVFRVVRRVRAAGILLFCLFGFMATFEPMAHSTQLAFRWIYGVAGSAALGGLFAVNRRRTRVPHRQRRVG